MRRIGLTGNSGSGKSLVAQRLRSRGIPVIDADKVSSSLLTPGTAVYENFARQFASWILPNGKVDRKGLAARIFTDETRRRQLNKLMHPAIIDEIRAFFDKQEALGVKAAAAEAALLMESDIEDELDLIWVVTAPFEIKMSRIRKRDSLSELESKARLMCQPKENAMTVRAHAVINNNGSEEDLFAYIDQLVALTI